MADDNYAVGRVYYGNQWFFWGDYVSAEKHFTAAIELDEDYEIAYNNRGLARFHLGKFDDAITDFNDAMELDPNYVSPYINMGKCLAAQRKFNEAEEILRQGLQLALDPNDPGNARLWYNLGWVYDELQRFDDANDSYTRALRYDPNHHRARIARGIACAKQGNTRYAESDFYTVINSTDPNDMARHLAAYNLQHMRGPGIGFHNEQAAQHFQDGVFLYTVEQYRTEAQRNAMECLEDAAALEPNVPEIPWMMFWTLLMDHDPHEAAGPLAQAQALQDHLIVDSVPSGAQAFLDGIDYGITPRVLHVFPSKYDLTLRREDANDKYEWVGPAYTDGTRGMDNPSMRVTVPNVAEYSIFGPAEDADVDWLADAWELDWLGHLLFSGEDDLTDGDSLPNRREYWCGTDPTETDSDHDGITDVDEIQIYGSNPKSPNTLYFVNDASVFGDVWCTAAGDDTNSGLFPWSPKSSIQAVVSTCQIGPGSVICVDRGNYLLGTDVELDTSCSGTKEQAVILQGTGRDTILFRQGHAQGSACISLDHTSHVIVRSFRIRGGECGVRLVEPRHCRIERCDVENYRQVGLLSVGVGADLEIRNVLTVGGTYGLEFSNRPASEDGGAGVVRVGNCTFARSTGAALRCENANGVSVRNSVLVVSNPGAACLWAGTSPVPGHFSNNCYYHNNSAVFGDIEGRVYSDLASWQQESSPLSDVQSFFADPAFASEGDYHLQSAGGRLHGEMWVEDETTSPCVDRGSIYMPYDQELAPNGRRVNLGRYGGTEEASKSRIESWTAPSSLP
ncbi:MAG: tetratricopeptide repeat protein [Sedimentisphaerales bacterium]|nr:tetratricopeptide repeat protein [Sedimentisphaerales bacterium]